MINEIQPKIKFQNIVQCPFKYYYYYYFVGPLYVNETRLHKLLLPFKFEVFYIFQILNSVKN